MMADIDCDIYMLLYFNPTLVCFQKNFCILFSNHTWKDVRIMNPDRYDFNFCYLFKPFIQQVIVGAEAIVSPSVYLMNLLRESLGRWIKNQETHHRIWHRSKHGWNQETNIILSTGRLLDRKGFKELILAVSEKDIGYEVHICGDGPEMNTLQQLAQKSATKVVLLRLAQ